MRSYIGGNIHLSLNGRLHLPADTDIKAVNRNGPVRTTGRIIGFSQCITKKEE